MSKVTVDPRCPSHPGHQVYQAMGPRFVGPMIWVCAACMRPLGLASFRTSTFGPPWPQGRTEKPSDMAHNRVDWEWLFGRQDRSSR